MAPEPLSSWAGDFSQAGPVSTFDIAKWNGTSWSDLGAGAFSTVNAMAVFDDGTGPGTLRCGQLRPHRGSIDQQDRKLERIHLVVARHGVERKRPRARGLRRWQRARRSSQEAASRSQEGGAAERIARWDGTSWAAVGGGLNNRVTSLAVGDAGGEPALYAGGFFTSAGGMAANHVATWDGTQWRAMGSGANGFVQALGTFRDARGTGLYVGGLFTLAPDSGDSYLARWGCRRPWSQSRSLPGSTLGR